MKRNYIFAIALACALAFGSSLAVAQTAPAMKPAPAPVAAPMPAVSVTPALAPMPAPAPVAAPTAPKAAAPAQVTPAPAAAPAPVPEWKKPEFWISNVVLPILLFVLGLGWFKKTWAQWLKEKGILVVADKVANGFATYAAKTPALWDDALAQALKAVIARFGELSPEQEATVKGVIEERKAQAEAQAKAEAESNGGAK